MSFGTKEEFCFSGEQCEHIVGKLYRKIICGGGGCAL